MTAVRADQLSALLARIEAAEGPDRELDFELHIALIADEIWPARDRQGRIINPHSRMSDYLATFRDVISADDQDFGFPRYAASVDAALALKERCWPGHAAAVGDMAFEGGDRRPWGCVWSPGGFIIGQAEAKTPALALLCAMLTALIAEAASPSDARDEGPGKPLRIPVEFDEASLPSNIQGVVKGDEG